MGVKDDYQWQGKIFFFLMENTVYLTVMGQLFLGRKKTEQLKTGTVSL